MSINVNEPTVFPPKAGCFTTRLRQDFGGQAKLSRPYSRLYIIIYLLVTVAQLAERRPVEANVAGSNPVSHPEAERSVTKTVNIFDTTEGYKKDIAVFFI